MPSTTHGKSTSAAGGERVNVYEMLEWAFAQGLPRPEERTLVAVVRFADKSGVAWPGQKKQLARLLDVDERTIRRHLVSLEERGVIRRYARTREQDGSRSSDLIVLSVPSEVPLDLAAYDGRGYRIAGLEEATNRTLSGDQPDICEGPTGHLVSGGEEPGLEETSLEEAAARAREDDPDAGIAVLSRYAGAHLEATGQEARFSLSDAPSAAELEQTAGDRLWDVLAWALSDRTPPNGRGWTGWQDKVGSWSAFARLYPKISAQSSQLSIEAETPAFAERIFG